MWYLKNASPMALEAAFMGMCHFCFRCRRPSCPQCWDAVHGVCGACVEEARLPFRMELAPLDGVLFPPATPPPPTEERAGEAEFVCVRRGRFGEASTGPSASVLQADEIAASEQHKTSDGTEGVSTGQKSFPVLKKQEESIAEEEDEEDAPRRWNAGMLHVAERVLTAVVLVVLVVIVVLILATAFSPFANAQIARVLHIDIRAEIAYVLHLVQLLH